MKQILLLTFIFCSGNSIADTAAGKVSMLVESHVNIIEEIKVNKNATIKSNSIVISPNKMVIIQTPQATITRSSGKSGKIKSLNNKKFEIFF